MAHRAGRMTDGVLRDEPSAKERLAVFDVDGTLFRRGLLPALTRRLVDEGVFPEKVREELSEDYYAWVERRGSHESYDKLVVELFRATSRLRSGLRYAPRSGWPGSRYTGELLYNPLADKRQVLGMFLADANMDLKGSVGLGDTLSDVGFLEMVETPIVFNPNRALFEVALKRRWSLVVERKDVIYNLLTPLEDPLLKGGTQWAG